MWNDALPRNGITNWSVFYAQPGGLATGWQSWMKPAGCSWVYFFSIGAGSGGARPANNANTIGGGGGASGAVARVLIPATVLPDIIYIRPGIGGVGATTAGSNGGNSSNSGVSIAPNTTSQYSIFSQSFSTGGNATTGAGGTAVGAITSASGIWLNVGLFTSIGGQNGGAGAAAVGPGSSVVFGASGLPITAGSGGGCGNAGNGGDITGSGLMPTIPGGLATNSGSAERARDGFRLGQTFAPGFKLFPLLFSGGTGGGGVGGGNTAGTGGNGAWGCGGGGGGSGTGANSVSGNGGNGGDGLILIGAF